MKNDLPGVYSPEKDCLVTLRKLSSESKGQRNYAMYFYYHFEKSKDVFASVEAHDLILLNMLILVVSIC